MFLNKFVFLEPILKYFTEMNDSINKKIKNLKQCPVFCSNTSTNYYKIPTSNSTLINSSSSWHLLPVTENKSNSFSCCESQTKQLTVFKNIKSHTTLSHYVNIYWQDFRWTWIIEYSKSINKQIILLSTFDQPTTCRGC